MCLAQGHNTVMPVRLKPAVPRSRVKHSTTGPLRSLFEVHSIEAINEGVIEEANKYFGNQENAFQFSFPVNPKYKGLITFLSHLA